MSHTLCHNVHTSAILLRHSIDAFLILRISSLSSQHRVECDDVMTKLQFYRKNSTWSRGNYSATWRTLAFRCGEKTFFYSTREKFKCPRSTCIIVRQETFPHSASGKLRPWACTERICSTSFARMRGTYYYVGRPMHGS